MNQKKRTFSTPIRCILIAVPIALIILRADVEECDVQPWYFYVAYGLAFPMGWMFLLERYPTFATKALETLKIISAHLRRLLTGDLYSHVRAAARFRK